MKTDVDDRTNAADGRSGAAASRTLESCAECDRCDAGWRHCYDFSARQGRGRSNSAWRTPGQGLTPEECERLFTPYYTTKQHGTGLGLAIVQSVIADHAGTIAVESREGQGATFVITLPRAEG